MPVCTASYFLSNNEDDVSIGQLFQTPVDICIVEVGYKYDYDCAVEAGPYPFLCGADQIVQVNVYSPDFTVDRDSFYGTGPINQLLHIPEGIDALAGDYVGLLGHVINLVNPVEHPSTGNLLSHFTPYCRNDPPTGTNPPFISEIDGIAVEESSLFSRYSLFTYAPEPVPGDRQFYDPNGTYIGVIEMKYTVGCCGGCGK